MAGRRAVTEADNEKYAVFEIDMGHRGSVDPIAPRPKRLEVSGRKSQK